MRAEPSRAHRRFALRAFSLIELLVVISIIALLIALTLPAMGAARRQARAAIGFANLRSLAGVLVAYAHEQRDAYPNPFRPVWPGTFEYSGMTWTKACSTVDPQQQWDFWNLCPTLHTELFSGMWYSYLAEWRGGHRNDIEQVNPTDGELMAKYRRQEGDVDVMNGEVLMPTSYAYPPVFWCKPTRFTPCRAPMEPMWLETQLTSSVAFPSAKVLLIGGHTQNRQQVALCDGTVEALNSITQAEAVAADARLAGTCICNCPPPPQSPPQPMFATLNGVKGIDLPRR